MSERMPNSLYSYPDISSQISILEHPDVAQYYEACVSTAFPDDEAYQQGLLAFVHGCDTSHMDENAGHTEQTIIEVGLALAEIHRQTGHYAYCLGELYYLLDNHSKLGDQTRKKINDIFVHLNESRTSRLPEAVASPVSSRILTM